MILPHRVTPTLVTPLTTNRAFVTPWWPFYPHAPPHGRGVRGGSSSSSSSSSIIGSGEGELAGIKLPGRRRIRRKDWSSTADATGKRFCGSPRTLADVDRVSAVERVPPGDTCAQSWSKSPLTEKSAMWRGAAGRTWPRSSPRTPPVTVRKYCLLYTSPSPRD